MDFLYNEYQAMLVYKQNNMVHSAFIETFLEIAETSASSIECPVCMEKITHSTGMKLAVCGHYICNDCLGKIQDNKCPLCRCNYDF